MYTIVYINWSSNQFCLLFSRASSTLKFSAENGNPERYYQTTNHTQYEFISDYLNVLSSIRQNEDNSEEEIEQFLNIYTEYGKTAIEYESLSHDLEDMLIR